MRLSGLSDLSDRQLAGAERQTGVLATWCATCMALVAAALVLFWYGDEFAWQRQLEDIPALWLAGGLVAAGLVFVLMIPLIRSTLAQSKSAMRPVLGIILISGLAMRLIMIPAVPALEDDFYRYLWDGAVTASGHNPYAIAPGNATADHSPPSIRALAANGAAVLDRVNHPKLKTIYPPVAQAAFALSYWIEPWSLRAWRVVCLLGEVITLALLLALLRLTGRSPLWVALYWLNPLIVKELMNTAHMEAIVMPFVLATVTLLVLKRPVAASVALGFAIGAKLWPVMLLPLVLRPLLGAPARLIAALGVLGIMAVAWALPPLLGGLGSDSGFVAYASHWQTNSALFQVLQSGAKEVLAAANLPTSSAGTAVRLAAAVLVFATAVWLSRTATTDPMTIIRRAAIVVFLLFLLSPAQFPWYASWVLIFAPFLPLAGLISMSVFLPFYYVSFHFYAIQDFDHFYPWLVWVEWVPIWLLFAYDGLKSWRQPLTEDLAPR